jgi:hypothetical protein
MYKKSLLLAIFIVILGTLIYLNNDKEKICLVPISTPPTKTSYIGQIQSNSGLKVRLLVLKHCFENMADKDANLALEAANLC